eukprot:560299-Alexandrium_andersonii.AAC.1
MGLKFLSSHSEPALQWHNGQGSLIVVHVGSPSADAYSDQSPFKNSNTILKPSGWLSLIHI